MVKIDFTKNFGKVPLLLKAGLIAGMKQALQVLLEELKRLTPEDTKAMLNSYKVGPIKQNGDSIVGSITNDTDYAIYVEYGVKGKVLNYHKPKGSIFRRGGDFKGLSGNRTFAQAVDNKEQEILNIIAKAIGF